MKTKKYFTPFITNCRSQNCRKRIAILRTSKGNSMPTEIDSLNEQEMFWIKNKENFFFDSKRHISHYANCPDAKNFRKDKEGKSIFDFEIKLPFKD